MKRITRIQYFLREHARRVRLPLSEIGLMYLLSAVVATVALGIVIWLFIYFVVLSDRSGVLPPDLVFDEPVSEQQEELNETFADCEVRSNLNGVCLDGESDQDEEYIAVMVENSADAWPLAGMSDARLVYEAPVEGDIPRFMLLFERGDDVDKVGPVRSARPYYLDWLSEYGGAMYMHVGGSPAALETLKTTEDLFDLNEFYRSWYFWRSDDRYAPHNTYTRSKLWQKAWDDYEGEQRDVPAWVYSAQETCEATNTDQSCATDITVEFLPGRYSVRWEYSSSTGQYQRYQGSTRQLDQDGTPVVADTIIVQRVEAETIDNVGRKRIDTIGSGELTVLRDGHVETGTWHKDARQSRTWWHDESGDNIALKPGKIWVEVLPTNRKLILE